jgi:hypothetical protein
LGSSRGDLGEVLGLRVAHVQLAQRPVCRVIDVDRIASPKSTPPGSLRKTVAARGKPPGLLVSLRQPGPRAPRQRGRFGDLGRAPAAVRLPRLGTAGRTVDVPAVNGHGTTRRVTGLDAALLQGGLLSLRCCAR